MEQSTVANWQIGRLELFFEGSWGQVCAGAFGAAVANVACRSMGFGSGTIGPSNINFNDPVRLVTPESSVTRLGCTGQEANLLQCPGEMDVPGNEYYSYDSSLCISDLGQQLVISCVAAEEDGAILAPTSSCYRKTNMCRVMRGTDGAPKPRGLRAQCRFR